MDQNHPQNRAERECLTLQAQIKDFHAAQALLSWDLETLMPPAGYQARAEVTATLAETAHTLLVGPKAQELASSLLASQDPVTKVFLRDHARALRLPASLVAKQARVAGLAHEAWLAARDNNSWALFAPHLEETLQLKREEAELLGYEGNRYDALLEGYEPGLTVAALQELFGALRVASLALIAEFGIEAASTKTSAPVSSLAQIDQVVQLALARKVLALLGLDQSNSRLDLSVHPFCSSIHQGDIRVTTRIQSADWRVCFYSVLHEAGHALYESGFAPDLYRTLAADGASYGMHESQALFWENCLGRSLPFCQYLSQALPALGDGFTLFRQTNTFAKSLIRTEADELTYNLHIILRFELELALLDGSLSVKDLPEAWNEGMQSALGLTPPDHLHGCLQDIHWAHGSFGYFPSYTLGRLYAASLWESIPDFSEGILGGDLTAVKAWLAEHIHRHGRTMLPAQLMGGLGLSLSAEPFLGQVREKLVTINS